MKSVIGTVVAFIGVYIIIENGILSFFAQKPVIIIALGLVFLMLIIAAAVLGIPHKKKGGGGHENTDTPRN